MFDFVVMAFFTGTPGDWTACGPGPLFMSAVGWDAGLDLSPGKLCSRGGSRPLRVQAPGAPGAVLSPGKLC